MDKFINKIITGDTLEVLKTMPSESVDCVITSPPYYGLRSYLKKDNPLKVKEIGSETSMQEHLRVLLEIFAEVKRVLKPAGNFFLNYGDIYGGCKEGKTDKKVSDYLKKEQEGISKKLPVYEKSLMMLPERIALKMIDDDGDDDYELRKDLTKEEKEMVLQDLVGLI
jgi:DNA modification methylase